MNTIREVKADYWRNRDGSIVHTNECMHSGGVGAHPWKFADGWTSDEVVAQVEATPWLRFCSKCHPPGHTQ